MSCKRLSCHICKQWSCSLIGICTFHQKFMYITKTCLYKFDPRKPHFYIVKLGFTGVYIIFHISARNIDCWYWLEPPRRGGSNEYPQSLFWAEIWKNIGVFVSEKFQFLEVKFSIYLNRSVFVMKRSNMRKTTFELRLISLNVCADWSLCCLPEETYDYWLSENSWTSIAWTPVLVYHAKNLFLTPY